MAAESGDRSFPEFTAKFLAQAWTLANRPSLLSVGVRLRRLSNESLLRGHLIQLFGQIDSQEEISGAETRAFFDHDWSAWTVDPKGMTAHPVAVVLALKSSQKFDLGHHDLCLLHRGADDTHGQEGRQAGTSESIITD